MARTVFLTLLLVNLVMLAWIYLNGASRDAIGREPQRVATQLAPERIRIVDAPLPAQPIACQGYAGLAPADAEALVKAWTEKFPAVRFNIISVVPKPAFDVVLAGFASRAAAETRLVELKAVGVGDALQVRSEVGAKFSLVASFADRFGAEAKQRSLVQKGIANVAVIDKPPAAPSATIEARGTATVLAPLSEQARNLTATSCAS